MSNFTIKWIDAERVAQSTPGEPWPENVALVENPEADAHCITLLERAPHCGLWELTCGTCGKVMTLPVFGRHDDPRAIAIACYRRPTDGK